MQVTPNSDYPLDLYILMDLSRSMQDDLDRVRELVDELSKLISNENYVRVIKQVSSPDIST